MAQLTAVQMNFILHWGEMGSAWGVNRAIAQIYALLYLSSQPLTADEIGQTLELARSTVSTSLRELHNWGLIRVVPVLGDRRDYFESLQDAWEIFRVILRERKRREFDPTLALLRQSAAEIDDADTDPYVRERLHEMLTFFETAAAIYDQVVDLPKETLNKLTEIRKFGKMLRALGKE